MTYWIAKKVFKGSKFVAKKTVLHPDAPDTAKKFAKQTAKATKASAQWVNDEVIQPSIEKWEESQANKARLEEHQRQQELRRQQQELEKAIADKEA